MEAHEALERFEKVADESGGPAPQEQLARNAAVLVAVLAAFLAVASFLSNTTVKDVITGETKADDTNATLEANDVKTLIASANSTVLRVVASGNPKAAVAVAKAQELETRIQTELVPRDTALRQKITADERQRSKADSRHLLYELAVVGLQIGIVLAGISILVRRRWLLGTGGLAGLAGAVLLFVGLAY